MFVLTETDDVIKIKPSCFKNSLQESIIESVNKKLANKVSKYSVCYYRYLKNCYCLALIIFVSTYTFIGCA